MIQKFTRHDALRIKAVAIGVAAASWIFPLCAVLFLGSSTRPVALVGFLAGGVIFGISLVLGWPLYCPWCCGRLFFTASIANSPGPSQLWRQFVPHDIVAGDRVQCPHCHSRFALPDWRSAPVAPPAEPT